MSVRQHGVAWVELPRIALGVDTRDIARIREAEVSEDAAYDLDARFGGASSGLVRILELTSGKALATRAEVRVELLADEDVLELPEFVSTWAKVRGLARVAQRQNGFGFLIDPEPFFDGLSHESQGENDVASG